MKLVPFKTFILSFLFLLFITPLSHAKRMTHVGYFQKLTAVDTLMQMTENSVKKYCSCMPGKQKNIQKGQKTIAVHQVLCLENSQGQCSPASSDSNLTPVGYFQNERAIKILLNQKVGNKKKYCACEKGQTKQIKKNGKKITVFQALCHENTSGDCSSVKTVAQPQTTQPEAPKAKTPEEKKKPKKTVKKEKKKEKKVTKKKKRKKLVQLTRSPGCYYYGPAKYRYGQPQVIDNLKAFCRKIKKTKSSLRLPDAGLGHISSKHWGRKFDVHDSHRFGRNTDFRPPRKGNLSTIAQYIKNKDHKKLRVHIKHRHLKKRYSKIRARRMVKLFYSQMDTKSLLFNDTSLKGVSYWKGHYNHFHHTDKSKR